MRAIPELLSDRHPGLPAEDLNPPVCDVRYLDRGGTVVRELEIAPGSWVESKVARAPVQGGGDLQDVFEASWLRSAIVPPSARTHGGPRLRIVDLFSGCGGLSLGAWEACRASGVACEHALIADTDERATAAFANFFGTVEHTIGDVTGLVDGELGAPPTPLERSWKKRLGPVDVMFAGPPCQGHSNLNNHTRRHDVRNLLYLKAARFVEVFRPRFAVIENVATVVHDKDGVVRTTRQHLESLRGWRRGQTSYRGYAVENFVMRGVDFGLPQARRRHFLLASTGRVPDLDHMLRVHGRGPRTLEWAISDLADVRGADPGRSVYFDTAPTPSPTNQERIRYLFKHNLYELPDAQRPPCHRNGGHSYTAVYGRLRADEPSPTITTGFGSPGQGRFIHPSKQRTLTPHEAARLQYFPDFFRFDHPEMFRGTLHKLIGNAVPPRFSYLLMLEILRGSSLF